MMAAPAGALESLELSAEADKALLSAGRGGRSSFSHSLLIALAAGLPLGYALATLLEAAQLPVQPTIIHRAVVATAAICITPVVWGVVLATSSVCFASCRRRFKVESHTTHRKTFSRLNSCRACDLCAFLCVVVGAILAVAPTSSRDDLWTALAVFWGYHTPLPEGYCPLAVAAASAVRAQPPGAWWRSFGPNGVGWGLADPLQGYYVGNLLAVPRLRVPSIQMMDASHGFRTTLASNVGRVTSFPSMLALGASWDETLLERVGAAMAEEFKAKGANVLLGPGLEVHRSPLGGRNGELISGEEPMLGAMLATAFIAGIQSHGVAAVAKHFILNQQETARMTSSSEASDRVIMEIYSVPFAAAANAGVAAVMCSYNLVGGEYMCGNHRLLQALRRRLGFDGFVVSDWWAVHSYHAAASGVDVNMPGNDGFFDFSRLDSELTRGMAERVLHGMLRTGTLDHPAVCVAGCDCDEPLAQRNATSPAHAALAEEAARAGVVLLKNDRPADAERPPLPLRASDRVALIGSVCFMRQESSLVHASWDAGDYFTIGGSARVVSDVGLSVSDALEAKGVQLLRSESDDPAQAVEAMQQATVAVVCAGATSGEGKDRISLALDQDALITELAARPRSIPLVVVLLAPGAVSMPWAEQVDAAAVIFFGGQATGAALAAVLTGSTNPSARLPVTFPLDSWPRPCVEYPWLSFLGPSVSEYLSFSYIHCAYNEGLQAGWRAHIGQPVAFAFGHGLSYTSFSYTWASSPTENAIAATTDPGARITFNVLVTNTGDTPGAEVVQLYLAFPDEAGEPARLLRGFKKTPLLEVGVAHTVTFELAASALSVWHGAIDDDDDGGWKVARGNFTAFIGPSSRTTYLMHPFKCE